MNKEIIYITADKNGAICLWSGMPELCGERWEGCSWNLITEYANKHDIKEKYGFSPEPCKSYEVEITYTYTVKEVK